MGEVPMYKAANLDLQLPRFVLEAAGIRQPEAHIRGLDRDDSSPRRGLVETTQPPCRAFRFCPEDIFKVNLPGESCPKLP